MTLELADLKPSVLTAFLFFLYWLLVANLAKYVFNRFPVPGITQLVNAA